MRGIKLRHAALATVSVALTAVGVIAGPATAAPADHAATKPAGTGAVVDGTPVPGGFASWQDLLRMQARLNAGAARITNAGAADSGFAGVVADPTARELRVYWKGQAPAALIASVRTGVPVTVLPARYSKRQLSAAAARVLARFGDRISTVGARPDGAGLLVGVQRSVPGVASHAGVPVSMQVGVSASPASRVDDSPPWWGGGRWRNAQTGGGCSTGFAVVHAGVNRMLSAGHCGVVNQTATDPTGQVIGTIIQKTVGSDTLIINGTSAGRVFNNSTDASGNVVSEFNNPVIGALSSQVGNFVCTSGSYSGTRCSIKVVATGLCINVTGVGIICNEVQAEQTAHTNGMGQGDSGGPVEIVNGNNPNQVYATGTNTAIDSANTTVACTGYVPTGRICAWRVFYQDIFAGMAAVGATAVVLG